MKCLSFCTVWLLRRRVVNIIIVVSQGGVGLATESCLQHNKWQRSEPGGRELGGERRPGGVHQISESSGHTSPDKAQHPPLQGN